MTKEYVEIELQINGKLIVLERAVEIQEPKKKRAFAYLKLADIETLPSGTLEIWVREAKKVPKHSGR